MRYSFKKQLLPCAKSEEPFQTQESYLVFFDWKMYICFGVLAHFYLFTWYFRQNYYPRILFLKKEVRRSGDWSLKTASPLELMLTYKSKSKKAKKLFPLSNVAPFKGCFTNKLASPSTIFSSEVYADHTDRISSYLLVFPLSLNPDADDRKISFVSCWFPYVDPFVLVHMNSYLRR